MAHSAPVARCKTRPSPLDTASPEARRIVADMVRDILELSRQQPNAPSAIKFRIGNYEWREPDYRQIRLWAKALKMTPASIVQELIEQEQPFCEFLFQWADEYLHRSGNIYAQGRMLRIRWNLQQLPLTQFKWIDGLRLTHLCFAGSGDQAIDLGTLPLPSLAYLDCTGLTALSKLHFSSLAELEVLLCGGCPDNSWDTPSQLRLSHSPKLKYLECYANALAELDLSATPMLKHLDCSYNQVERLVLSSVPELISLVCSFNKLRQLDLTQTPELRWLDCALNHIERLDLSTAARLQHLDCTGNRISEMDLSSCPELAALHCDSNPLPRLDIRPLGKLKTLRYDKEGTRLIQRSDQHF